ncbi:VOC family protein [Nocardia huaxiensis]|uniref:VOC family protein n=1 Tax=Nocardia huaxiensis TaxID=2755382 RepID=A0A7D6ZTP5_9NOCA|nr:VOC family protein [Nocardia huaxiensis]QLY28409.1 VOC family protein [Nocardia huaxiensis]
MAIARLGAISLDSDDPAGLGDFYHRLLELEIVYKSDDAVVLRGKSLYLTIERIQDHRPPVWPEGIVPKQMHLDLFVNDLNESEAAALALGARKPEYQPSPDRWRVLLDPSGHPFCLTLPMDPGVSG